MKKNDWQPSLSDCPPSLLRTLLAFVDQGSVSKAAAFLKLQQPAVSRRLKAFVGRRGAEGLLERLGPRRLLLTERGKMLLPRVREVVVRYEDLLEHLRGRQQAVEVVRTALGSFGAQLYLPPVLAAVERQQVWRLETRLMRGRERIVGVAEGRFDLALVTHSPEDVSSLSEGRQPLAVDLLAKHAVVVIAHPKSEAGQALSALPDVRELSLGELGRWPLVGLDEQSGLRRKLEKHVRSRGKLKYALEGYPGGWAVGREYARHQLGVALLPLPLLTAQDEEDFVVCRLASPFVIEDYVIRRAEKQTEAQAEAMGFFRRAAAVLVQKGRRRAARA